MVLLVPRLIAVSLAPSPVSWDSNHLPSSVSFDGLVPYLSRWNVVLGIRRLLPRKRSYQSVKQNWFWHLLKGLQMDWFTQNCPSELMPPETLDEWSEGMESGP